MPTLFSLLIFFTRHMINLTMSTSLQILAIAGLVLFFLNRLKLDLAKLTVMFMLAPVVIVFAALCLRRVGAFDLPNLSYTSPDGSRTAYEWPARETARQGGVRCSTISFSFSCKD
jgi:hypothetical protein